MQSLSMYVLGDGVRVRVMFGVRVRVRVRVSVRVRVRDSKLRDRVCF